MWTDSSYISLWWLILHTLRTFGFCDSPLHKEYREFSFPLANVACWTYLSIIYSQPCTGDMVLRNSFLYIPKNDRGHHLRVTDNRWWNTDIQNVLTSYNCIQATYTQFQVLLQHSKLLIGNCFSFFIVTMTLTFTRNSSDAIYRHTSYLYSKFHLNKVFWSGIWSETVFSIFY